MSSLHVFEFDDYLLILSILVDEKDNYKQIRLTIKSESAIQCERNLRQMR
jgi:hypothetical protein